jgi:cytochrome c oxidase assembly factor CtaG
VLALVLVLWAHRRGHPDRRRASYFAAATATVGVALISPLDAMSSSLASAHMVQHLLLVLVAAPLLALSAPSGPLMRGTPSVVRHAATRWRRRLGLDRRRLRLLRDPVVVSLLHAATLWFWHAAVPYDAALRSHPVHVLEHATFLGTGVLFWGVVLGSRAAGRVSNGFAVLLVFTMAMQSVVLSMLLTFASTPWYPSYATTTQAWDLEPLADQQLAGVIMWVPAGLVYVGVALALFGSWLQGTDGEVATVPKRVPPMPDSSERMGTGSASGDRLGRAPAAHVQGAPEPTVRSSRPSSSVRDKGMRLDDR